MSIGIVICLVIAGLLAFGRVLKEIEVGKQLEAERQAEEDNRRFGPAQLGRSPENTTSGRPRRHLRAVPSPKVLSKEDLNEMEEWFSEGTNPEDYA